MPVSLRAYTQATYRSSNTGNVNWPIGTVAGDLAILNIAGTTSSTRKPTTATGWTLAKHTPSTDSYWKIVTATDIAAPLAVTGYVPFLTTYSGAGGIGAITDTSSGVIPGAMMTSGNCGLHVFARGSSALTPAADKLGTDVTNTAYSSRKNNVWFRVPAAAGYFTLSGAFNGSDANGFEIIPVAGPSAPALLSPVGGVSVDAAAALSMSWCHNSSQGVAQESFKLRIREAETGTWYYLLADGTLSLTETAVSTSTNGASVAIGQLVSGKNYEWQLSTSEAAVFSDYSSVALFSAITKPTVDSITVTSPIENLRPLVEATATVTGLLTAYQVRICLSSEPTADNPLYDSNVIAGSSVSHTVPVQTWWSNGQDLYAWVRVAQSGGLWSSWTKDNVIFEVTWTPPSAPTGLTAANQTDGPLVATISGITAGMEAVQLEMSRDTGTTWTPVGTFASPGTSQAVDMVLAEYGVPVRFRARVRNTVDEVDFWSAWKTMTTDVSSTDRNTYFVSQDGSEYLRIDIHSESPHILTQGVYVNYGLADADGVVYPRVDRGPKAGIASAMQLHTSTDSALASLVTWITTRGAWVCRWGPERAGTPGQLTQFASRPSTTMTFAKEVSWDKPGKVAISDRIVSFTWVEQRPS